MYRIAITGKANSGKNTVGKLLSRALCKTDSHFIAFADPIKEMARIAFPEIPRKWLYGSSKLRAQVIPDAFKNGSPLTVRQLLIDLGNDFGRKYRTDLWLKNFDIAYEKLLRKNAQFVAVTDVRFRNEFDHLKDRGFFQIRLLRDSHLKIDDESETNQDNIRNEEFNAIIHNNGTMRELKAEVEKILILLTH